MPSDIDGSMKRMAAIAIIAWAILGVVILKSPVLLIYILMHVCATGVFLFFFLRKEKKARVLSDEKKS